MIHRLASIYWLFLSFVVIVCMQPVLDGTEKGRVPHQACARHGEVKCSARSWVCWEEHFLGSCWIVVLEIARMMTSFGYAETQPRPSPNQRYDLALTNAV